MEHNFFFTHHKSELSKNWARFRHQSCTSISETIKKHHHFKKDSAFLLTKMTLKSRNGKVHIFSEFPKFGNMHQLICRLLSLRPL